MIFEIKSTGAGDGDTLDGAGGTDTLKLSTGTHTLANETFLRILKNIETTFLWIYCCTNRSNRGFYHYRKCRK